MKCHKKKYDKLGAMFALSQTKFFGNFHSNRNECRIYFCQECKCYHLTSKNKRAITK